MERDEILQSLQELKRQLPVDGLDQTTIEEQAKRFDDARRASEKAESRIAYLEEKLKKDENYKTDKMAFYDRTIEENRREVADMISRSDRLAAELIRDDRRLETARKQRVEAETFGDTELLARLDANIARLEEITDRKSAELDTINSNIKELETLINNQENHLESEGIAEEIENLKAADRAEIAHLNMEIKSASTEAMLSQYNFATSLNDLISDYEKGNISEEVVKEKLVEYKERLPKQFLLRDAAARTEEKLQLEEALAKYEPRLAELEEKLANEDNYRGVYADSLVAVREAGQADLDRYTDEIKQNGSRIVEINNEMRRFETINKESQEIIDQRKKEIAALPNQRHPMKKHLEAEISRREQEIERNVTAMHSLRSEKGMLSSNIDRLRELTKPLKVEIEKINKEIAEDAKKINKSQQRLDKIERDDLVRGIESSKQRLAYIEYDVSETIDNIVGNLDKAIAKKAKVEKEETKEVVEENKDKKATPIVLGTGAAALNGVVKEDEDGKNFIVVYGPNGEELLNVEIPKNVVIPEKKEEETVVAPLAEEKEEEKSTAVPILGFKPASEELKEEVKKKGIIAKLKGQCTRFKEKAQETKEWLKKNKKRIAAGVIGTVAVVGLLTALKGCDGELSNVNNDTPPIENVITSGDIEMPTFDFETSGDVTPELTEAEKIAIAWDVIRGDYGNTPERRENLENAGYDADEIQDIVNELLKDMNNNTPAPVEPEVEEPTPTPEPELQEPTPEPEIDEPVVEEPGSGDTTTKVEEKDDNNIDKNTRPNSRPSRPSRPSKPSDKDDVIGGGDVPEDPKPVDPDPVVPTDDIVVDVLPGETYITFDGNYVQNTGNGVNSETGGVITDVIQQGGSVGAVVSGSENDKALANGNLTIPSTGVPEDDVLKFYEEMGIKYENPTNQKTGTTVVEERVEADLEDELVKEEFVPLTTNPVKTETVTNPTGANVNTVVNETVTTPVVEENKVVEETVTTTPVVEENKVVEEAVKTTPVVEETKVEKETVKEQESLPPTGLSDNDVLSFYEQLGITPPTVDENSMNGRTR